MSNTINVSVTLVPETCCNCGVVFGIPAGLREQRLGDHKDFWCPNGHGQHFTGKTEAEKLRDELKKRDRELSWAKDRAEGNARRADAAERSLSATKGVVTKMKKRAKAGVCPCCNRHFTALERHMASKHPGFVGDDE